MAEVVKTLKDEPKAQAIADCAWEEVACADENSYQTFSRFVDATLSDTISDNPRRDFQPYKKSELSNAKAHSWASRQRFFKRSLGFFVKEKLGIKL